MLDLKYVLDNMGQVSVMLKNRGMSVSLDELSQLNEERKKLQKEYDGLKALQNQKSDEIAKLKKEGKEVKPVIAEMHAVAARVKDICPRQSEIEEKIKNILLTIPNRPHASVPVGADTQANAVVKLWGKPRVFDFAPKDHGEIGENLGLLDTARAAKLAGSRFAILRGGLAKLERALIHFMLEKHTQKGYEEILPPYLVNDKALLGTGQLPKFEADMFKTTSGHYLISTAEIPLTNFFQLEVLEEKNLPYNFCAVTPCFRSEAGSYGKDVMGLIRQHQFNKVELVKISKPETSYDELEKLTCDAEHILEVLDLPYRRVVLCTGDLGFAAAKTYDLEVWLPSQGQYREISSCSNCEDFQARRMNTRYKGADGKLRLVHTLNGSGLAVGRTLIAILENYQQGDGSVAIPKALQSFMGSEVLRPR